MRCAIRHYCSTCREITRCRLAILVLLRAFNSLSLCSPFRVLSCFSHQVGLLDRFMSLARYLQWSGLIWDDYKYYLILLHVEVPCNNIRSRWASLCQAFRNDSWSVRPSKKVVRRTKLCQHIFCLLGIVGAFRDDLGRSANSCGLPPCQTCFSRSPILAVCKFHVVCLPKKLIRDFPSGVAIACSSSSIFQRSVSCCPIG